MSQNEFQYKARKESCLDSGPRARHSIPPRVRLFKKKLNKKTSARVNIINENSFLIPEIALSAAEKLLWVLPNVCFEESKLKYRAPAEQNWQLFFPAAKNLSPGHISL